MKESNLLKKIQKKLSPKTILFRNNVGMGWIGKSFVASKRQSVMINPGDVVIRNGRPLHAGLCKGSSDLIGWTNHENKAIFTAVEGKTGNLTATREQINFMEAVRRNGGISGIARSDEEAENLINGIIENL